jgi:hypothetical protein
VIAQKLAIDRNVVGAMTCVDGHSWSWQGRSESPNGRVKLSGGLCRRKPPGRVRGMLSFRRVLAIGWVANACEARQPCTVAKGLRVQLRETSGKVAVGWDTKRTAVGV